ncbi:Zn-dependent protease [Rhodothalassium salexigens DSM 2132]|uniref:Zinc metalloprotease n=1 Tax=Rhodothalassium salexigens DSM 2132 TaxID=1188247 RepID=A0A4R2PRL5_RHOSA|nr:site-2 protease family protein [Rhodothalassium salexigens]MBB4210379.1 Zn-dependent protease [Rhodothalassium salexigens DSM 2132]MBK1638580.1 site-2 protease family protein [Rhodothalassium salexigens DSM 2132]TCP38543.1 Zn-dependent protease [Rhodothalassium salexigens DSM 2132]
MFKNAISLFKIFGFDIRVDPSWLLLAFLITWSLSTGYFPLQYPDLTAATYWSLGLLGMLGLMVSLILHEMSHSVVARRYGLPVGRITLFIFGGVAELQNEPESAKSEFWVAIAGPIASLVLAGLFWGLAAPVEALAGAPAGALFAYLGLVNLILAIFNLIPAFPLDGGRVLRAALWHWRGSLLAATRTATDVGKGFGLVLITFGVLFILTGNLIGGAWWIVIGLFVRAAADGSYQHMMTSRILAGEPVSRFMTRDPICVSPETSLADFVDNTLYRYHHDMFPVLHGRQVLGAIGPRQVRTIAREDWSGTAVGDAMTPLSDDIVLDPDTDTAEALTRMQRSGRSRFLVVRRGRLVGLVTLKDIVALLQLKMDLGDQGER